MRLISQRFSATTDFSHRRHFSARNTFKQPVLQDRLCFGQSGSKTLINLDSLKADLSRTPKGTLPFRQLNGQADYKILGFHTREGDPVCLRVPIERDPQHVTYEMRFSDVIANPDWPGGRTEPLAWLKDTVFGELWPLYAYKPHHRNITSSILRDDTDCPDALVGIDWQAIAQFIQGNLKDQKAPLKTLMVGVAKGQELFSYLALIYQAMHTGNADANQIIQKLQSAAAFKLVDNRAKNISLHSQLNAGQVPPSYASKAFRRRLSDYEVILPLQELAAQILDNDCHWQSPAEQVVPDLLAKEGRGSYDIVSANNVLCYIDNHQERAATAQALVDLVKSGGLFVFNLTYVHGVKQNIEEAIPGFSQKFKKIGNSVYQKR